MKKSYGKGVANHTGPESCGVTCKGDVEALTGGCAGRVFSRERHTLRDADAVGGSGRQHRMRRYREAQTSPARSQTPSTYGHASHENREILCLPAADDAARRIGKSKDVRR
jgi:RNA-directed DNA polymerase